MLKFSDFYKMLGCIELVVLDFVRSCAGA